MNPNKLFLAFYLVAFILLIAALTSCSTRPILGLPTEDCDPCIQRPMMTPEEAANAHGVVD